MSDALTTHQNFTICEPDYMVFSQIYPEIKYEYLKGEYVILLNIKIRSCIRCKEMTIDKYSVVIFKHVQFSFKFQVYTFK